MDENMYLNKQDYAYLKKLIRACDELGYFPTQKQLAMYLGCSISGAGYLMKRLKYMEVIELDTRGRYHVMIRPEWFVGNLLPGEPR